MFDQLDYINGLKWEKDYPDLVKQIRRLCREEMNKHNEKAAEDIFPGKTIPQTGYMQVVGPIVPFNKHDQDKAQWHLLPWEVLQDIVEVLTSGEKKYPGENWKKCTDRNRYLDANDRHMLDWRLQNGPDAESGKSHLIHAICNLLFLAALEKKGVFK